MLVSPPCGADRTGPSFTLARVQINESRAEERLRTFDDSVTGNARLTNTATTVTNGAGASPSGLQAAALSRVKGGRGMRLVRAQERTFLSASAPRAAGRRHGAV